MADTLIKISSDLTYRQLMILSAVGFSQITGIKGKEEKYTEVRGLNNVSIASEIFDLYRKSLIFFIGSNIRRRWNKSIKASFRWLWCFSI